MKEASSAAVGDAGAQRVERPAARDRHTPFIVDREPDAQVRGYLPDVERTRRDRGPGDLAHGRDQRADFGVFEIKRDIRMGAGQQQRQREQGGGAEFHGGTGATGNDT